MFNIENTLKLREREEKNYLNLDLYILRKFLSFMYIKHLFTKCFVNQSIFKLRSKEMKWNEIRNKKEERREKNVIKHYTDNYNK